METLELKMALIQWILIVNDTDLLQRLWKWKETQKAVQKIRFLSSFGAWQSESGEDLLQEIYGSRYFENREISL